jgi:hypothetical protein
MGAPSRILQCFALSVYSKCNGRPPGGFVEVNGVENICILFEGRLDNEIL